MKTRKRCNIRIVANSISMYGEPLKIQPTRNDELTSRGGELADQGESNSMSVAKHGLMNVWGHAKRSKLKMIWIFKHLLVKARSKKEFQKSLELWGVIEDTTGLVHLHHFVILFQDICLCKMNSGWQFGAMQIRKWDTVSYSVEVESGQIETSLEQWLVVLYVWRTQNFEEASVLEKSRPTRLDYNPS